jgi:hypothetical protein
VIWAKNKSFKYQTWWFNKQNWVSWTNLWMHAGYGCFSLYSCTSSHWIACLRTLNYRPSMDWGNHVNCFFCPGVFSLQQTRERTISRFKLTLCRGKPVSRVSPIPVGNLTLYSEVTMFTMCSESRLLGTSSVLRMGKHCKILWPASLWLRYMWFNWRGVRYVCRQKHAYIYIYL